MNFPLALCLLATYVALGVSLSCETCQGFGNTCSGQWQTCPPNKDSCVSVQVEGSGVLQAKVVMKTCIQSSECVQPPSSMNLGKAGRLLTQITCCEGNKCKKDPPALPPVNTTPNGKKCPACYVVHTLKCEEETIDCAGDENYCFEVSGTTNLGGMSAEMVMKGCTSSVSCNSTHDSGSFGSISVVAKASCTPAIGAASSVVASFGFLLQAFMGLLLLKLLG
uniref:phospholipase A2 inhibitor and Ly6/PLAUR domain-containing protein-like n=1 Tax=Euleptes europaea TaxID=460621 RepID=UPI00253FE170|nr:phospholipase A2 inhibitor and Ly6/PLAUR domain-containing protein-like [Euleptes europaea]